MTQVGSFILFRKQDIDCGRAIAVIILSSLNQRYWIPQAVAVPKADTERQADFLDRERMRRLVRKRGTGGERGQIKDRKTFNEWTVGLKRVLEIFRKDKSGTQR